MQPAGGVGEHHIASARTRRRQSIEYHRSRVSARKLRGEVRAGAFRPHLQLLDGRRAKGVTRGEQHRTAVLGTAPRQLADGGGLARAIHADHQDHEWAMRGVDAQRRGDGLEDLHDTLAQSVTQRASVGELLASHARAQLRQDPLGGLDADVRSDEARLELFQDRGIDLPSPQQVGEVVGEPGIAAVQAVAQATDEAGALIGRCGRVFGSAAEHIRRIVPAAPYGWITVGFASSSVEPGGLAGIPAGGIGAPVKLMASVCISTVTAPTLSSMIDP